MLSLRRVFALVAIVVVAVPLAVSPPLVDPDEGLHAAIAQEMVARGDYVTPRFLGEPFLDKPILFFWAEAASLRLFGNREFAVRLPPLLFGVAGMLSVALLGGALFGTAAGLTSGIVYGTMMLPLGVSQVAVHDIGVVPFMCVAAWCVAKAALPDLPPSSGRAAALGVLAGICFGLSILTKGLVGLVFVGIIGACLAAWKPSAIVRIAMLLVIAGVVAAFVAAPWYIAMERAHPGYLHYYFVERHVQGYLTATQRHAGRPFWYYVPIVLGGALPWTLYLAAALRTARGSGLRLAAWGWLVLGLIFLSAGESKLVTYALPLFPAVAILIGEYARRPDAAVRLTSAIQTLLLAVLPAAALFAFGLWYEPVPAAAWIPIAALAALTLACGRLAYRAHERSAVVAWLAVASLCSLGAMLTMVPHAAAWMTAKDLAAALNRAGALPPRVSVLDERIGSLVFYLDPPLRAEATRERLEETSFAEAVARIRHDPEDAVLAVRNDYLIRFNRLFPAAPEPDIRAGTFSVFRIGTLRRSLQNGGMLNPPHRQ
jgi:4-amino-4-deoxy-L-arabinose transferase-like glycosyltransferase